MKAPTRPSASDKLLGDIQLARIALARAESKWELADEQARAARRRRKEAKQAARRARKHAKQAKQEFAEARKALADAEETFAGAVERAAENRRLARARLAAKAKAVPAVKKKPGTARKAAGRKVRSIVARPRGQSAKPKPRKHRKPTETSIPGTVIREAKPISVPRDFEMPTGVTLAETHDASTVALPADLLSSGKQPTDQPPVRGPAGGLT